MKKAISILLVLAMCLSLYACGNNEQNNKPNSEPADEKLTALEDQLLGYIYEMTSEWDMTPKSKAIILEIGNYEVRSDKDPATKEFGPDTVVVRLQFEKATGDVEDVKYKFCLTTAENTSEDAKIWIKMYTMNKQTAALRGQETCGYVCDIMDYVGTAGQYSKCGDILSTSDEFSVSRMNKSLNKRWTDYWDSLGVS